MKHQVLAVRRGSSGHIHDDRVLCRRGNVSPRYGQLVASGIPILRDASARLVSVEVPDTDCLRAKVAERVPNSCVCRLRRHALSGVFRRHPVSCLIHFLLIGKIQCGSGNEIPVDPMESGQCDSCLILVIHRSPNRIFHRLPRQLVVESPTHPTLQIGPRFLLGGLDRIQIAKRWRTQDQARRNDRHQMAHKAATLEL
jgi:hypothetical protein